MAAVAYVDPGNFATNVAAGARDGYLLVWVVVAASLMAMLVQYLSAKLGIATGRNLAELCRDRVSTPAARGLWLQGELVAAVTDVAELVGAALGLRLLFGVPLPVGGALAGALALALLAVQRRGSRAFELAIAFLLGLVVIGFVYETLRVGPSPAASLGGLRPDLHGEAVELAVGIVGATIMPHAVYLHSDLTTRRPAAGGRARRALVAGARLDVVVALGVAGLVNVAMLVVAARAFHGRVDAATIVGAHQAVARLVGGGAALVFAAALLVAGISSSTVGTAAGDVVMRGFTRAQVPVALRRTLTVVPGVALLAAGVDPTALLVLTQVVLGLGLPVAVVPLVRLTADRQVMGVHVNTMATTVAAAAVAAVVIGLDLLLVAQL